MHDGVAAGWTEFFLGELGAAAALGGLVIVAISINLERILSYPHLPGRAGQALIKVMAAFLASSVVLIPRQPAVVLGLELAVIGAFCLLIALVKLARDLAATPRIPLGWWGPQFGLSVIAALPLTAGGALLALSMPEAIYWIAAGVLISLTACVLDAWILLVEIKR